MLPLVYGSELEKEFWQLKLTVEKPRGVYQYWLIFTPKIN
jgi:hypothetical protein